MPATLTRASDGGTVLLFARLWDEASKAMTPTLARHVLKLGFTDSDKARMHELAEKNSEGGITPKELGELDDYVKVSELVSILHAKARIFLKNIPSGTNRHA